MAFDEMCGRHPVGYLSILSGWQLLFRFDCERVSGAEWADFGSYLFFIPALEYVEGPGNDTLACTVAWNDALQHPPFLGSGASTPHESIDAIVQLLQQISPLRRSAAHVSHVEKFDQN